MSRFADFKNRITGNAPPVTAKVLVDPLASQLEVDAAFAQVGYLLGQIADYFARTRAHDEVTELDIHGHMASYFHSPECAQMLRVLLVTDPTIALYLEEQIAKKVRATTVRQQVRATSLNWAGLVIGCVIGACASVAFNLFIYVSQNAVLHDGTRVVFNPVLGSVPGQILVVAACMSILGAVGLIWPSNR